MKSKTINDSKKILEEFTSKIRNLKIKDIEKIKNGSKGIGVLERAFKYFDTTEIEFHNLISEIKEEFNENKCLSINTQEESEEKQLKVNSLEDTSNEIRVVFAVDKLNEGWDVLNLFDIVRLYDTRDARKYKPGKTTIAEAQLIGRGARYCPFQIDSSQDKYRRKYDYDLENDLRILEELYYHSAHNPKYIQELKVALRYTGMLPPTEPMRIDIKVKEDFKKTDLWKNGFIFVNEPEKYGKSRIKDISTFGKSKAFVHSLDTGFSQSIIIFETNEKEDKIEVKVSEYLKFRDINKAIIRKVLSKIEFYKFNNLKKYFPELSSISEFMDSLSEITIEIKTSPSRYARLSTQDRFEMSFSVLEKIKSEIEKTYTEYVGTKIFKPRRIEDTVKDRKINVVRDKSDTSHQERGLSMKNASDPDLRLDIGSLSWHIYDENYGTSEEKHLIHFINSMMKKMENKYTDIYLLRNEKLFQLYRFCDGKPIEPDFVLFLKEKDSGKIMYYQLIMEAKGEGFLEKDEWKEQFLKEIEENYQIEILTENEDYRIIGMPFFNYENNVNFIEEFDKKLNLGAFS
jgi:type III restriction enzyme